MSVEKTGLGESAGEGLITKFGRGSVNDTVHLLSDLVTAKGMKVFAVINHRAEAQAHGLELRETVVVIFGNPEGGTPVMASAPLVALDLPLKVLVWADGDQTKISYTSPRTLATRYHLSDDMAGRLAGIDGLTDALASG